MRQYTQTRASLRLTTDLHVFHDVQRVKHDRNLLQPELQNNDGQRWEE
jgi:hypothetical protein